MSASTFCPEINVQYSSGEREKVWEAGWKEREVCVYEITKEMTVVWALEWIAEDKLWDLKNKLDIIFP